MVTMSPCHHVTVSTYIANPIVVISVFNPKKAFPVLRLHHELHLLQDVLGTLSLMVCPLPCTVDVATFFVFTLLYPARCLSPA